MSIQTDSPSRLRRGLIGLLVAAGLLLAPSVAQAANPSILNTGTGCSGQTTWLISCATGGQSTNSANQLRISALISHDLDVTIASILTDDDWDGTVDANTVRSVSAQRPNIAGGYPRSRANLTYQLPTSNTGMSCTPPFSTTRRTDNRNARIRPRDSDAQTGSTTSSIIKFVGNGGCTGPEDFPYLYGWGANNFVNATTLDPGESKTFTYNGDDPDGAGSSTDEFDGVRWRRRNIRTGTVSGVTVDCDNNGDNATKSTTVSFPDRGAFVVEAELLNENCSGGGNGVNNDNPGYWFPLGTADVNSSAAPSLTLGATRPQFNGNTTVSATGLVDPDSADGGGVQIVQWDLNEDTGDGVSGFETNDVAGVGATLSSPRTRTINTTGQSPGLHTVRARVIDNGAMDAADNIRRTSSVVPTTYRVDAAPVADAQALDTESDQPLPITLTGSDPDDDELSFSIVSGPSKGTLSGTGANRTYNPSGTFAGTDSFVFQADDGFGRTDTATVTITVDPQTTITAQPPLQSNDRDPQFEFTSAVTDPSAASFECALDTETFTSCSSPQGYSDLTDGEHTFKVRALAGGNTDPTPAEATWTIDATPPDTQIDTQPPALSNSANAQFTFSSPDDPTATFECRLDPNLGSAFAPCTSPKAYAGLGQGSHTFEVRGVDPLGNRDQSPASYTWTVDTIAPATAIDDDTAPGNANANHRTTSGDANFDFFANPDPNGPVSFECRLDSNLESAFQACTSPKEYLGLGDGPHKFEVRGRDLAGNVDPTPAVWNWEIYTGLPQTIFDTFPANPSNSSSANFTFHSSIPDSTFRCRLDSDSEEAWEPCTSPQNFTGLSEEEHTFEVVATDEFGRDDPTPAVHTWTIDLTAPGTSIDAEPLDPSNVDFATFQFSSDESPNATFECRLDSTGGPEDDWELCESPKEYTGLDDGEHTFEVRAIDTAGNKDPSPESRTWTVDTTAPETTIDVSPPDPDNEPSPNFEFSSNELNSSFECRIDSVSEAAFQACTSPKSFSPPLSDGEHTFEVRATDEAGNLDTSPDTYTWTVDTDPPETTLDDFPPALDNSDAAHFEFSSDEDPSTFQCRLDSIDDQDFAACDSPRDLTDLDDGEYSFEVRAIDAAGNPDPTPASHVWTVDTTAPETTIDSTPDDPTTSTDAEFTFSSEDGAAFECRLDSTGGPEEDWAGCTSPQSYSGLSEGSHTFEVRATDEAGNTDQTPDSFTWVIDTTAPETTIDTPVPADPTNSTDPEFTFSSSEPNSTFECRLDSSGGPEDDWEDCDSPKDYSGLDEGDHTFEVRATDEAGNTDQTPDAHTWTIDTTAPDVAITGGPDDPSNSDSAGFDFTVDDGTATVECQLDAGDFEGCSSPQAYGGLDEGSHTFTVSATDDAGNVDTDSRTWTVDLTAPETTIDPGSVPADPTNSTGADFDFDSSELGSSFECRLDPTGGPEDGWSGCDAPKSYSGLDEGSHTFQVRATDPAGNTDQTPDSFTWTIDTTAPVIAIDSGPPNPSNSDAASFAFTPEDGANTIECDLDGNGFEPCSSPQAYSSLGEGPHTFTVRETDAAGNSGTDSYDWVVDLSAPETTIDSAPSDPTGSRRPTFEFSSSEDGSSFQCRIDSALEDDWNPCTSPHQTATLAEGSHTFEVRARDAAGTLDPTPASFTFVVDSLPPQTTITSGPSGVSADLTPSFAFTSDEANVGFECRVDTAPFESCTSPHTTAELLPGEHTFAVRARDAGGNADPTPAIRTFLLKWPPPSGPEARRSGQCANTILGTGGRDKLRGTALGDRLLGLAGKDVLRGRGSDDCLIGGKGRDRMFGGPGNDRLTADDKTRDLVNCGGGLDFAKVDRFDRVRGCEVVARLKGRGQ